MTQKQHIALLIMAAGAASRMGKIKQLLPWKETNLLLACVNEAKLSNANTVLVVLGSKADRIVAECNLKNELDLEFIINEKWRNGLGSSIAFGVNHILKQTPPPDGILICLADQPYVHKDYIDNMITKFFSARQKSVATQYKNRVGVPALFHKNMFGYLQKLNDDFGAKIILKNMKKNILTVNGLHHTRDIDTEEDYRSLRNSENKTGNTTF